MIDLGGKDISGTIGTSPILPDCALFSLLFPLIPYYSQQKKPTLAGRHKKLC